MLKRTLTALSLIATSLFFTSVLADSGSVCTTFFNAGQKDLTINHNFSNTVISQNSWSPVFNEPNGEKYNFLNGQVAVYFYEYKITKDGNFSIQGGNSSIPAGQNCSESYKILVFPN